MDVHDEMYREVVAEVFAQGRRDADWAGVDDRWVCALVGSDLDLDH